MENGQADSPAASRSVATNAGSSGREWTAEELVCLQQTSKIMGVPFSNFMRFAETHGENDAAFINTHKPHRFIDSREWTTEELATFQRTARMIPVSLSRLLSFAEAAAKSLPLSQSSSTTQQSAKALPAPEDVNPLSAFNTRPDSNPSGQLPEGRLDASPNVPFDDFVPVGDLGQTSMFHTLDLIASSNHLTLDLGLQNDFLEHTHHDTIGDFAGVDDISGVSHSVSSLTGRATFSPLDLAEWLNNPLPIMSPSASLAPQELFNINPVGNIDPIAEYLEHRGNSDAQASSGSGIADPAEDDFSAVLRQAGERSVETRTDTTTNLMSRHVQLADEINTRCGDRSINPQILLQQFPIAVEHFPRATGTSSRDIDPTPRESSKSLRRSGHLDISSTAREKPGQVLGSRAHARGARRRPGVVKATASLQATGNSRASIRSLAMSSLGPCIRCSISHKSCVPVPGLQECVRCRNQKYSMSTLPCLYFQITDITLFRTMSDPISQKPYTILSLDCSIASTVHPLVAYRSGPAIEFGITQGLGTTLHLSARSFDSTAIQDPASPLIRSLYSHGYALADLDTARQEIRGFVFRSVVPYIRAKVSRGDPISWNIFAAACRRVELKMDLHEFLSDVLCLWTAARIIEGGWQFTGPQTLGIRPKAGESARLTDAAFIDYQFSAIVAQDVLLPLRYKVLKRLHELTHSNTSANWIVLFLANFILLHTYGLLMKQQRAFSQRRNALLRYTLMPLIRGIHLGAKALLAHFHHICKGQKPFEIDWGQQPLSKAAQRMAKLSHDEVDFITSLSQLAKAKVPYFKEIMQTDEYESEYWFTGQLFVPDWRPPNTIEESPVA
ncbi:hypothetical protein F4802DRAFT_491677 [Xylaria palmicola]|nr:hypothetical protein F4802DRAFT_491677 [Xylaria palmicola]